MGLKEKILALRNRLNAEGVPEEGRKLVLYDEDINGGWMSHSKEDVRIPNSIPA